MTQTPGFDKQLVHDELDRIQADVHHLLTTATPADLARPTSGTRWTNEQLLFHMLVEYIAVGSPLIGVVRVLGRAPRGVSRALARLQNAATRTVNVINYRGVCAATRIYGLARMSARFDRVVTALHRRLDQETTASLGRGMNFPVRWDPFFKDYMTIADIYRYPTQHYEFHRRQLTIGSAEPG